MNYVSDNYKAANALGLGCWHVPDPANQHASLYVGMGNNSGISISGNPWKGGGGNGGHRDGGGTTFHRPVKQPPRKKTPAELAAITKGKELRAKLDNFKNQYEQCLSAKRAAERKTHRLKPGTAKAWYMHGKGEPLYVHINSIDLSKVSMKDMNGGLIKVQLDNPIKHLSNIDDAIVYGDLYLQQVEGNVFRAAYVGKIKGCGDFYDFDVKWFAPLSWCSFRNQNTIFAGFINGSLPNLGYIGGNGYPIYIYGSVIIKP